MTHGQLEFAISQYLDGTLPPEEKAALERELVVNPQAAELLEQHMAIDKAVKSIDDLPAVKWDILSHRISDAVAQQQATIAGSADSGEVADDLELAIIQYVDGELPEDRREDLERRLTADPAARRVLAQHRSLDAVLKHAWAMPHVDYERLGERLMQAVGEKVAPSSYSITAWMRRPAVMAMAACMLMAIGLAAFFATRGGQSGPTIAIPKGPENTANQPVVVVNVLPPEAAPAGKRVEIVSIGAPEDGLSYDVGGLVADVKPRIEVLNETFTIYSDIFSTP